LLSTCWRSRFLRRNLRIPHHLNHVGAARLPCGHGLADQVQLRGLPGTEISSAAGANKQAQREIAPA